ALYADIVGQIALRSGNPRAKADAKEYDKHDFEADAWKVTAVRPRLDKMAMELRIVYENVRAPEPVYLMFRFRLVRDLPPGELPPEAVLGNNKAFVRLCADTFFDGDKWKGDFWKDKKAHAAAVASLVGAVLDYKSDGLM